MAKTKLDNQYSALAKVRDKPLRVAAFCRTPPAEGLPWLQHEHYSTLTKTFPNWTFIGCYAGKKSSHKNDIRMGGLPELITDCYNGKIDLIFAKSPHFFNRNTIDFFCLIRKLQELKPPVGIYFESSNLYTLDENFNIIYPLMVALAEMESEEKGKHFGCLGYTDASEKNILRNKRNRMNLTQKEVADKANIALRHYQQFELGTRDITNASFRIAMSVCKALNILPDTLMRSRPPFHASQGEEASER